MIHLSKTKHGLSSRTTNSGDWKKQMSKIANCSDRLPINIGPSNLNKSSLHHTGTVIEYSLEYMEMLRSFVPSADILRTKGHVLEQLSGLKLNGKKKCQRCGQSMSKLDIQCVTETLPTMLASVRLESFQPLIRCKYHDGVVNFKAWSCCGKHSSSDPCTGSEFHIPRNYPRGEIESLWLFYVTPDATENSDIRPVVAIDCEMSTAVSGDIELIRLTVIDYFSSAILVDSLVWPDVEMSNYNTRFSGVTRSAINRARAQGNYFRGRDKARAAVWRFVGPNTLVVGHSVQNDLKAMRWIHPMVVDTFLIESAKAEATQKTKEIEAVIPQVITTETKEYEPVIPNGSTTHAIANKDKQTPRKVRSKGPGSLSLKTLAMVKLDREIQSDKKCQR